MMLFGKTDEQKAKAHQEELFRLGSGVKRFAFLPVKLHDGRYAWLRSYWEYLMVEGLSYVPDVTLYAPPRSFRAYRRSLVEDKLEFATGAVLTYGRAKAARERNKGGKM